MAMFDYRVKDGLTLPLRKTAKLGPGDFRTAFRRIANAWLKEVDDGFARERDPYGNPWQELSAMTIEEKEKKGSKHVDDILQDTGILRGSFFKEVTRTGFSIGTNRVFDDGTTAEIHQFGGIHPRTLSFIPERPMLPFGEIPVEWLQIAEGYLGDDLDQVMS